MNETADIIKKMETKDNGEYSLNGKQKENLNTYLTQAQLILGENGNPGIITGRENIIDASINDAMSSYSHTPMSHINATKLAHNNGEYGPLGLPMGGISRIYNGMSIEEMAKSQAIDSGVKNLAKTIMGVPGLNNIVMNTIKQQYS